MGDWIKNIPTHEYVSNGETRFTAYCLCEGILDKEDNYFQQVCDKYKSKDMVIYDGKKLCICKHCFKNKKEILKEQFKEKFDFKY